MNWRLNNLMAGAALATSLVVGVTPAGAVGDAPRAVVAVEREYCSGLDSFSVHRLYRAYFLRDPDAAGLAYWQDVLATGRAGLDGISQLFATSSEFTDRYGSLSNRAFVRLVYRNVLHREGDQAGVDYWTGLLDAGHPRGTVMLGFSDSAEFKERTGLVPPVPAASDPQVLPEIDPFIVLPGGEVTSSHESETHRITAHRYPVEVGLGAILAYTGDQLRCLGWTLIADGSDGQSVGVVSENGIRIRAIAVRDGAVNRLLMVTDLVR